MSKKNPKTGGDEVFVRAVVMLLVVGGGLWAAHRYTRLPEIAGRLITQYRTSGEEELRARGGDAPSWPAAADSSAPASGNNAPNILESATPIPATSATSDHEYSTEQASFLGDQPSGTPVSADRFRSIELRLRELGATYSLLESWGAEEPRYRFHCRMAVRGSAEPVKNFEATSREPIRAMEEVLENVESWRRHRIPSARQP